MRVLSIPAGGTLEIIKKCSVHAFPYPRSYDYTGLVAFRRAGGYMDELYSVNQTIMIDFGAESWKDALKHLGQNFRRSILEYIRLRETGYGFLKICYMFWILRREEVLLHEPKPPQNYSNHVYFEYDEISSGKEIVTIESNK